MMARRRHYWTPEETETLRRLWGVVPVASIVRKLGLRGDQIHNKAVKMRLVHSREGLYSLLEVSRELGYDPKSILLVLRSENVSFLNTTGNMKRGNRKRYRFTDSQYEQIKSLMLRFTKGTRISMARRGEWGIKNRPSACAECGRSDRPHKARGICDRMRCSLAANGSRPRGRPRDRVG